MGAMCAICAHSVKRKMRTMRSHVRIGRVLRCVDLKRYAAAHLGGTLLGGDGGLVTVVDLDDDADGDRHEATQVQDPAAGTRLTCIPASEVARVDLRIE